MRRKRAIQQKKFRLQNKGGTLMKNLLNRMGPLVLLVAFMVAAGCASAPKEPEHRPKLGVAENSDGVVIFALTTHPDYMYAIYYEDPATKAWKIMPGCESIKGNGEQVEIKKKFNSRGALPAFTVRHTRLN